MQKTQVRFLSWEDFLEDRIPTLVFWPREFHGLYSPWHCKELDMTQQLSLHWVHKLHDMLCLGSSPRFLCSLNSKLNWGPEFLTDNPESVISADLKQDFGQKKTKPCYKRRYKIHIEMMILGLGKCSNEFFNCAFYLIFLLLFWPQCMACRWDLTSLTRD